MASTPFRFHGLDALRGVAALGVVLYHWSHFFGAPGSPAYDPTRVPMAEAGAFFYRHGWLAVDLFFCLSGFIFFWMYARGVADRGLTASRFAWFRFSRLYPLQLATLLLVAAGQWWLTRVGEAPFVYAGNDTRHFVLNLLFASSWGLESGYSFNGPAWSISVEVFLYAVFFVFCRFLPIRLWAVLGVALAGFALAATGYAPLGRGIGSFFVGGAVCLAWQWLETARHRRAFTRVAAALAISGWAGTLAVIAWPQEIDMSGPMRHLPKAWAVLALFPLTILALASSERHIAPFTRRIAWLGDISYSVYLLHFPLQLGFFVFAGRFIVDTSVYYSSGFMAAFLATLLVCAAASHRYLELPAQRWLRGTGTLQPHVTARKPDGSSLAGLER